jgi:hypothetical protein
VGQTLVDSHLSKFESGIKDLAISIAVISHGDYFCYAHGPDFKKCLNFFKEAIKRV